MDFFAEYDQIMNQAEQLRAQFTQANETVTFLFILMGVIGFLWCFFGLKLVRLWAALIGFFMGFVLGCGAAVGLNLTMTVSLVIGGAVGILLAVLSAWLYHVGIFLVVWAAGISVSLMIVRPENFMHAALCGAIGLVIGVIAVRFAEPMTMVMTGLYGAAVLADAISFLALLEDPWVQPVLTAVFAVLGIVVQFLLESRKRKRIHLRKAEEIRQKYSTENEVEKARAMMEELEQEEKAVSGKERAYED